MNPPKIDLRHLRYFVAVAEQKSFHAAALRLHVSQPPLTRQVQQLEEVLGVKLLLRHARGVELTDAGTLFLEDARNILMLTEQALHRSQQAGLGQLGRLDVGVFGSAVLDSIPRIILDFRRRYPNVEVVMHTLDRDQQIRALRERRITVGFNRFFQEEPGLSWEVVQTEPLVVAVPDDHPLAAREALSLQDLEGQPLVMYPRLPRPGFIDQLMRLFHSRGVAPQKTQEVDDVVTAVSLVSSGLGLCLVVSSAGNLRLPGVTYRPLLPADRASFDLCMIHRQGDESSLLKAFIAVARSLKPAPRVRGRK